MKLAPPYDSVECEVRGTDLGEPSGGAKPSGGDGFIGPGGRCHGDVIGDLGRDGPNRPDDRRIGDVMAVLDHDDPSRAFGVHPVGGPSPAVAALP